MGKSTEKKITTVKGGKIARDARTGRFLGVSTPDGVSTARPATGKVLAAASARRHAALERLKDR